VQGREDRRPYRKALAPTGHAYNPHPAIDRFSLAAERSFANGEGCDWADTGEKRRKEGILRNNFARLPAAAAIIGIANHGTLQRKSEKKGCRAILIITRRRRDEERRLCHYGRCNHPGARGQVAGKAAVLRFFVPFGEIINRRVWPKRKRNWRRAKSELGLTAPSRPLVAFCSRSLGRMVVKRVGIPLANRDQGRAAVRRAKHESNKFVFKAVGGQDL